MVNKWDLASKIDSSSYRKKILTTLVKGAKKPTSLQNELNIKMSHVSRSLKELTEMKLVMCLTPNSKRSRFYKSTKLGKGVLSLIEK